MAATLLPFSFGPWADVWPGPVRAVMKREDIRALREFYDDAVVGAICAVILGEFSAQPTCLYAHHGIKLRIKIVRPAENLCRNLIFLDWSSRVIQRVLRQVAEEFAQGLRAMQNLAADQFLDLREALFAFGQRVTPSYIGLTGV